MDIERELVLEHFDAIRDGSYTAKSPATGGNLNLRFRTTPAARPERERGTFGHFLNRLRVGPMMISATLGSSMHVRRKVFVRVVLEPEKPAEA